MRLRKCSLRKMMSDGLVNDQIKRQVLESLRPIATNEHFDANSFSNGDLRRQLT